MRRAKIFCTIGPASDPPDMLERLISNGMDVARLNFSHGTHDEHADRMIQIRKAAKAVGREVAILQDLCGPKIRCAKFPTGERILASGDSVTMRGGEATEVAATGEIIVQYEGLEKDLKVNDTILMDDGRVIVKVTHAHRDHLVAEVTQGGQLRDKVGVHLPADRVSIATLTEKDKGDLAFGLAQGIDFVALSFVRDAAEVQLVREICDAWGAPTPVVSKIETPMAVQRLESITVASDAVMVARGDLGVEFSPERVPVIQREILGIARRHRRPAIVATEMMQSMVTATRPTRAEASDVATAVFDGADAVMLSGETATGAHPDLVVKTMRRIIVEAETSSFYAPPREDSRPSRDVVAKAVARGACEIAEVVGAKVIVAFTESGKTAHFASHSRPSVPIVALSPNAGTRRRLCLFWGVHPRAIERVDTADEIIEQALGLLLGQGVVSPGDKVVAIYGAPLGVSGSTNAIQVRKVE